MARHSDLARHRAEHPDQSPKRRAEIIEAAEALFLERGIAATTMTEIAQRVGITRITLYRYFAGRGALAFEVAGRMLAKLSAAAQASVPAGAGPVEAARCGFESLIDQIEHNRDAYLYLTMFDSLRPFRDTSDDLERMYVELSCEALQFDEAVAPRFYDDETTERLLTLTNTVIGVLGKFATMGDSVAREQGVTLETQLGHLREVVLGYFDTVIVPQAKPVNPSTGECADHE